MGLTDTLKNIFLAPAGGSKPTETKQDVYPQVHSVYENAPHWPTFNFKNVDREGFKSNSVVYAGIRRIVQTFSEAPLIVQDDDEEQIPNHPLDNITSTPNEFMTETELFEITLIHWFISGNGFWGKVRDSNNDVAELWPLRPDRMRILPSRENFIENYLYEIGGDVIEIPTEDIVHFRFPDPSDAYWGQPPLQAAFKEIALDNESVDFNKTILQNYGVPGTVMKFEEEPEEDERERMSRRFKQKFGGANRGEPAFVGKETDIEPIGLDPEKLALPDTSDISETRVLMTLGVPPIVINAMSGLERSTFENTSQAWRWFYQATISPLHRRFSDRIDKNMMSEFRDGTSTDFDHNQVAALRQLRREDRELDLEEYKEGAITRAEYRRRRGMEVNEADDVYRTESRTIFRDPDGNGGPDPQQGNIYDGLNDDKSEHDHPHDEKNLTPDEKEFKSHFPNGIEHLKDSLPRDDQTEVIRDVLNRRKIAEEYIGPLKSWAVQEFELQRDDMMAVWANSTKALDQEQFEKLRRELMRKQSEWRRCMVMGSEEINPFAQVMRPLIEKSARSAAEVVGASFTVSNERVTQFVREYTYKFAQNMAQTSVDKLRGIIREAMDEGLSIRNTRDLLDEEFTSWTTDRTELVARSETTRAANAGAQFSYQEAGVQQKQWLAATDACPYCDDLDGTVVSTQANFLDEGTSFFPDGASSPLQISYGNVGYPPVHPNCRCTIVPVIN